jgi:hypothetical protein
MGQQQLLLIVLGLIIVGTAVVLAITLFRTNALENKRDIVINEALHIATLAQNYYKKPISQAGGGNKFTGWKIPDNLRITSGGEYEAMLSDDKAIIIGTGNDLASSGDLVQVQLTVTNNNIVSEIVH